MKRRSGTRRTLAACCNTPLFLDYANGHWLNLYGLLWPQGSRPPAELRMMPRDLAEPGALPRDIPNAKTHPAWYSGRLFLAWMRMGFRNPKPPESPEIEI